MPFSQLISRAEFGRAIWRAVVPLLLLLLAQAALLTILLLFWVRSAAWVRQSEDVIARANDIERLLVSMEAALRGYMLTADRPFLEPFEKARARVDTALVDLRSEVSDNAAQLGRVASISEELSAWLALRDELGEPAPGVGMNPRQLAVLNDRRVLMEGMRRRIQEIKQAELELKSTRSSGEDQAALIAILGGVSLSVLIGIGLALSSRRTVAELLTTYQRALDSRAETGKQFSDLAEAIPQLVWISDAAGKHLYFNHPWLDFTGRKVDSFLSAEWKSMLHPADYAIAIDRWQESLRSGTPYESEYRLRRASDGTFRWFLCRATAVLDKDGKRVRWFGTCTDVDSQKQLEAQREAALAAERAARSDLLRTSRVKDEFLATLSHELRTPMTAILGWARLLRNPANRTENLDRAIESIESNAAVQARLIDDLLDMSRIISGKLMLKLEPLELSEMIRIAVEAVQPGANNKDIELSVRTPETAHIMGDAARIQQVIWNLLSNAVKFTPTCGKVLIELVQGDSTAMVIVSDSGIGIDPAFLPFVFDRFRQADGTITRQHGGLGLGLAIAKNLVELHGGAIGVASRGNEKGATFTVELPLAISTTRSPDARPQAKTGSDLHSDVRGRRVLIVDDSVDTAQVIAVMLDAAGMRTVTANSGEMALKLLFAEPFDLLISDIGMPTMDGYALIRRVREREQASGRRIGAVALTAFARPEDRQAALDSGYNLHVAKPVSPEQLYRAVALALPRSGTTSSVNP